MKVLRLPQMDAEAFEALEYYKAVDSRQGPRFVEELESAIARLQHMPLSWKPTGNHCRRCLLKVFPYQLIYGVTDQAIVLVALAHTHRRPDYWRDRLHLIKFS